ncbi:MAG: hypothetical protein RLZZ49_34 [Bacteroidota bacterium]|jgi:uncharacterized protein YyaL (SSP411 family)
MNVPNRLILETSPYLLQHAYNPVDWYPWTEEALQKAREEDKLILVSIGYSACHWCHVMEHESFEDPSTALLMNKYFVCIKVDREERPDLDHFFMDALQAITGQGGWPLNMFLTPDGKPFYGGTYFPPQSIPQRISWKELLVQLHDALMKRRTEIELQAKNLLEHLQKSNQVVLKNTINLESSASDFIRSAEVGKIFNQLMAAADRVDGGFGHAPKFPQTYSIQFLLRYHHFFDNDAALDQALLSLKKMMRGGIYDHVGGGFCRYSTDGQWKVPHFEKMAYDNALLLTVLTEAYQVTNDQEIKRVVVETIEFLKREMLDPSGGFYAALDADSEGVEGKFYVWSKDEFDATVGEHANIIGEYFNVESGGNWEHSNILFTSSSIEAWATTHQLTMDQASSILLNAKQALLQARASRVRPGLDDKIILGWNALLSTALLQAANVFRQSDWKDLAVSNIAFLISSFYDQEGKRWKHTFKNNQSRFPAFLDDMAYLIQSLIMLHESTGSLKELHLASELAEYVIEYFSDEQDIYFYFTPDYHNEVLVRKVDLYDGAVPSGNSIMAWNLSRLGIIFNRSDWRIRSLKMLEGVETTLAKYPSSFGKWGCLLMEMYHGIRELAIIGQDALSSSSGIHLAFLPNKVLVIGQQTDERIPLLQNRPIGEKSQFYVCHDYTCRSPVDHSADALKLLLTKSPE